MYSNVSSALWREHACMVLISELADKTQETIR